jgi:hypothetical protein
MPVRSLRNLAGIILIIAPRKMATDVGGQGRFTPVCGPRNARP